MDVWVRSTVLILILCLAGCAAARLPAPPVEDITPSRKARRGQILDDLQRRRDRIEYQAAVSRGEQGDLAGCESMLRSILDRNAAHRDARLLLSDLHASRGDLPEARRQLRRLLEHDPDDAEARAAMARLTEKAGYPDQAGHAENADRRGGLSDTTSFGG